MSLQQIELILRTLGAVAGLLTLAIALVAVVFSLRRAAGRQEPGARFALRGPVLILATSLFLTVSALLWRPLPLQLGSTSEAIAVVAGLTLLLGGLTLYLWGLLSLRRMFAISSGFGVRLHANHALVTSGPYAYVRHPMYLAVILSALGSLLLYQTWAALFFAVAMFGLVIRASREERVLAAEFAAEWEAYASQTPKWLPQLPSRRKGGA